MLTTFSSIWSWLFWFLGSVLLYGVIFPRLGQWLMTATLHIQQHIYTRRVDIYAWICRYQIWTAVILQWTLVLPMLLIFTIIVVVIYPSLSDEQQLDLNLGSALIHYYYYSTSSMLLFHTITWASYNKMRSTAIYMCILVALNWGTTTREILNLFTEVMSIILPMVLLYVVFAYIIVVPADLRPLANQPQSWNVVMTNTIRYQDDQERQEQHQEQQRQQQRQHEQELIQQRIRIQQLERQFNNYNLKHRCQEILYALTPT